MPQPTRLLFLRYGAALASVGLALLVRWLLDPILGDHQPFFTFVLAVLVMAWYGGFGPTLVTVLLGALAGTCFFAPPRGSLALSEPDVRAALALYLLSGMTIALLAAALHTARRQRDASATEATRSREALATSETRYRLVSEAANDAIWDWDLVTNRVEWNEGVRKLFGYRSEQVGSDATWWYEQIHPGDRERVVQGIHAIIESEKELWQAEYRFRRADGSYAEVFDRGRVVRGPGGQPVRMAGSMIDLTERKKAEAVLREQAQVLTGILAATVDHIYIVGRDGRYRYVSRGGARALGYEPHELAGKHWRELGLPADVMESFDAQRDRALQSGQPIVAEVTFRSPQGEDRQYEYNVAPIAGENGEPEAVVVVSRDVTERRRAEQDLKLQARVLESMAEGVSLADEAGVILYTNPAEDRIFGYNPGELIGQHVTVQNAYPPEENKRIVREVIEQLKTQGVWVGEWQNRRKDGTPFITFARITALETGGRRYFVCVQEDVTEQRKARAALEESEQRFRQLAEHITDVFWMTDPVGATMLYVSPAYETIWGRSCQSLYEHPRSFLEAVHPEDRARVTASLERQAQGEVTSEEYRVVRPDGTIRWIWDRGFPIRDAASQVVRVGGLAEDITERKLANEALRESEARLRRIVESNVVGLVVADFRGRILEANDEFLRMVGYTRDELQTGKLNFLDLTPPEYHALDRQAMEQMAATGRHTPFEKEYLHRDGTRVPVLVGTAYLGKDQEGNEVGVGFLLDLSARKKAEQALRESEERFRGLMEQAPFSVQVFDAEGRPVRVNRAWEELWGVTLEQIPDYNILHDPQLEAKGVLPLIRQAFAGEVVHIPAIEYDPNETIPDRSRHSDPRRWVAAVAYPLKDVSGRVREVVLVHEDRTARLQAEEALRESEEKFRLLADTIPQLAWMARPDGHIFWYNRRWYEYTGTTPEQMQGWGWQAVPDPEVLPAVVERWRASLTSGEPFDMVFPLRGADGQFRPFLTRVNPLRDDQGRILYWFGTNTDISEQKRIEEASRFLADVSAALAAVVDYESTLHKVVSLAVPRFADWCTADMIEADGSLRRLAVAHPDPRKIPRASELGHRYRPDPDAPAGPPRVAGTGEPELVEEIPDALLAAVARDEDHLRTLRELGLKSYVCVPMKARGKVLGVLTFVMAESGRRYRPADLALAQELAGRAAVAVENARLYAELREADQRKNEFLAVLAHELRNPLAPIRNAIHVLKLAGTEGEVLTRAREMAERQVHHLTRLVDDLLDVSRIMRGKVDLRRERTDLATIVARAVETARPVIEAEGHDLTLVLPEQPVWIHADLVRMAQVVSNLLNNAAKYTEPGGQIWLVAGEESGQAVVHVRDTGIGIPSDMLPRIFDMFMQVTPTADRSKIGLGIGLTLVKNLVELHGGTVEAHSEGPGQGSEFLIRLPLAAPELSLGEPSTKPRAGQSEPPETPGRRVLIVDDNVDAAESLALLLTLGGHEVQVAHDGASALQMAEVQPPDVAFLDIGMPTMDGYELARRFRDHPVLQEVYLVALTGWGQEEDRRRTREAGFDHHLVKPVEPEAVQRILADRGMNGA